MDFFEMFSCIMKLVVVLLTYQKKAEYLDKEESYYNLSKEGKLSFWFVLAM